MLGNGEVVCHQSCLDSTPASPAFPRLSTKASLEAAGWESRVCLWLWL